jgi:diguanylate cyclase (GGDEF)-like protein
MFKFWYKNFSHIPAHHPDFHRVQLIYHLLLFVCVLAGVVTALNFFLLNAGLIAVIDAIGFFLALGIYFYFRHSGNVAVAGWAVTLIFIAVLSAYLSVWGGNNLGIIWATVIPPIAFFLLGRSVGTLLSIVFFSYATYIVYGHVQAGVRYQLSLGGILNVVEVLIAQIMLFRFYDRTRADAMAELQASRAKLQRLASTDKLTGINNRQQFDRELMAQVSDAQTTRRPLTLLLLDVDHFKRINDEHGHLFGDRVLKELASLLSTNLRSHDVIARWGGEEFAVLMPATPITTAMTLAERLRKKVADANLCGHSVTISGGLSGWRPGCSGEELLGTADRALYRAKTQGRNTIVQSED